MLPPMLRITPLRVSSSAISLASGRDLANRSSLVTTKVSPLRHAARAFFQAGPVSFSAGKSVVGVDHVVVGSQAVEGMTLGGEVLVAGRAAGITDEHNWAVAY